MAFPKTEEELIAAGYTFNRNSTCTGQDCGRSIQWWTTPKGKQMPLDPMTMEPHWSTCPNAGSFRKKTEYGKL